MIRISAAEHARRRQALMAQMTPGSIALLPAAPATLRNRDVEHDYRQDSDFQYLSGFPEPEALIALIPGRPEGEYVLFCRPRDPERELWDGRRAGTEGAVRDFAADEAHSIEAIDSILPGLLDGCARLYYPIGVRAEFDRQVLGWLEAVRARARQGAVAPGEFVALDRLLHAMRLLKSEEEIALMQAAADISARAHVRAMQHCRPGLFEFQVEAELEHEFRKSGARLAAYGSIVAGGGNACILHYRENDAPLVDGELLLIDAGCELDCYASDITRTFPVNGRFSAEQKAIYQLVLDSQLAAIEVMQPGEPYNRAHEVSVRVITEGLVKLGILQGEVDELIAQDAFRAFYMHGAGHWLGMDVHDVGDYKIDGQWRPLEPGMTITIEPGIYIAPDCETVEERWRGIGVRIEDDVLITADGNRILTAGVPKTVAEIETLMAVARED